MKTNGQKIIKVYVSSQEHEVITHRAKERNMTTTAYAKMKLLDKSEGINDLKRQIIGKMPIFYNLVHEIQEPKRRTQLTGWGEDLWQYLK